MREIKFRVWNTKTNKMIINVKEMGVFALKSIYSIDEFLVIPTNEKYPLTQYTGLKIKNIEIYENDIIRARKDYLYKVVFENGSFVLYHLNKYDGQELIRWGLLSRLFDSDMKDILEESEIIGNIYENPELLKDKI
jgi:uncharacterized phage protein (TIGR01671 family)